MATINQVYKTEAGWHTYNSNVDQPPTEYVSGPYSVNQDEAQMIEDGAEIMLNEAGTDVIVYWPVEVL